MTRQKASSRVVEVLHRGVLNTSSRLTYEKFGKTLVYTRRHRDVIDSMLAQGVTKLTGVEDCDEAWRSLFSPGDLVGIKVVPVGGPQSLSSYELVDAIAESLVERAGVKRKSIIVFDRFKKDFLQFGYDRFIDSRLRWECASEKFEPRQSGLDGLDVRKIFSTHVTGYSREHYFDFPVPCPFADPDSPESKRSYLCKTVATAVDKVISIPVLKDHVASGLTFALKNMSHGFFNNVYRSHPYDSNTSIRENCCGDFIPSAASYHTVREKSVLFVGDAIVSTVNGGPGAWNPRFLTYEKNALYFATDPVSIDTVGLRVLDDIRRELGLPVLKNVVGPPNDSDPDSGELYSRRHVEHIEGAAKLGLGDIDPFVESLDMS
jgi:hypothetical protein